MIDFFFFGSWDETAKVLRKKKIALNLLKNPVGQYGLDSM